MAKGAEGADAKGKEKGKGNQNKGMVKGQGKGKGGKAKGQGKGLLATQSQHPFFRGHRFQPRLLSFAAQLVGTAKLRPQKNDRTAPKRPDTTPCPLDHTPTEGQSWVETEHAAFITPLGVAAVAQFRH
eukprot:4891642-Amphidinium_carterae.1